MPSPLLIFSQSDYLIRIVAIHSHTNLCLNGKQCRSRSVGFLRSQLIWIYTVCKGRVYLGSAGQGFIYLFFFFNKIYLVNALEIASSHNREWPDYSWLCLWATFLQERSIYQYHCPTDTCNCSVTVLQIRHVFQPKKRYWCFSYFSYFCTKHVLCF